MITKNDWILWGILFALLVAIGVNFDDKIQNLFGFIIAGIMILKLIDYNKRTTFPIERTRDLKKTFTLTIIGLIVVYLGTTVVFWIDNAFFGSKLFGVQSITLQGIFNYFAQQSFIFSGNVIWSFVAIAGIVAISETWLLAVLMDFISDIFHVDFNLWKIKTYAMALLLMGFFVILHFNAKGLTAAALVPVAVFFLVSAIIIIIEKQSLAAMNMHVINNSIALAISTNLISSLSLTGPIIVSIIGIVGIYFLFKTRIFIKPIGG